MWPDNRILDLFGIQVPIIQAPMAGPVLADMVVAVSEAGGLGSLPCALLNAEQTRAEVEAIRRQTQRPFNMNFFCHTPARVDANREALWRQRLERYYLALGLDQNASVPSVSRAPFDDKTCDLLIELHPEVVSFHFGLPDEKLLARVRTTKAKIISSATSVDEARWLEDRGCDAIIAQGYEAGGHRGIFLSDDVSTQAGTMALVPQVVDALNVPVIAAGGIADARGILAAFALGAAAVQMGTAYLLCPEARISPIHRQALRNAKDNQTVLTNVFTGRPARSIVNRLISELGIMSDDVPEFPLAAAALAPLRSKSEMAGSSDFTPLWSGQAAHLARELPAAELTRQLAAEALEKLRAGREPQSVSN
ncbi:MAG TPA: nitronate monooxygenase [Acidobacteriaceae bacterium]